MAVTAKNTNDSWYWLGIMAVGLLNLILLKMDWANFTNHEAMAAIASIALEFTLPAYAMWNKTNEMVNAVFGGIIAIAGCFWLIYNSITVYSTSDVNLVCIIMSLIMIICGGHFVHLVAQRICDNKKNTPN